MGDVKLGLQTAIDYEAYEGRISDMQDDCKLLHDASYAAFRHGNSSLGDDEQDLEWGEDDEDDKSTYKRISKKLDDLEDLRQDLADGESEDEEADATSLVDGVESCSDEIDEWRSDLESRGIYAEED